MVVIGFQVSVFYFLLQKTFLCGMQVFIFKLFLPLFFAGWFFVFEKPDGHTKPGYFSAADEHLQYTGRIDFTDKSKPRFWAAGVYVKASFKGSFCEVILHDEMRYGKSHNYISVVMDDKPAVRIKLKSTTDTLHLSEGLSSGNHVLTICKSTESGIGYIEFGGIICRSLQKLPAKPLRKIEFIGNSITCGTGSDESVYPCGKGEWYDQHNAYMSYGPTTARKLNAQWQLTSVSGIGLIHSCCDMKITMPEVFDKTDMNAGNSITWDFKKYQPDVVTVCLGQNDGVQDSVKFCSTYLHFVEQIRSVYPGTSVVCLTSPMADEKLVSVQKNYLNGIVNAAHKKGNTGVSRYFFSKRYQQGCGGHPSLAEHAMIANELTTYIKQIKNW